MGCSGDRGRRGSKRPTVDLYKPAHAVECAPIPRFHPVDPMMSRDVPRFWGSGVLGERRGDVSESRRRRGSPASQLLEGKNPIRKPGKVKEKEVALIGPELSL